jgi:hypothetical protein
MRTIAPEIFADEFFGLADPMSRLIWLGMILVTADDQGRMLNNPALIRRDVFPYDDISLEFISQAIERFAHANRIVLYSGGINGNSKSLIQIVNWWKYQKSAAWMGPSQFPSPNGWTDRVRCHAANQQIVTQGWDDKGGFPSGLPNGLPSELFRSKRNAQGRALSKAKGSGQGSGHTSLKYSRDININNDKDKELLLVAARMFSERFGDIQNDAEALRILAMFKQHGAKRMEELFTWACENEIHVKYRSTLLSRINTAASKHTSRPKSSRTQKPKTAPAPKVDPQELERLRKQAEKEFVTS